MARRRLKPRFYLFLFVLAAIAVAAVILLSGNGEDVVIQQGMLKYNKTFETVIVRNEEVHTTEDYGKVVFCVAEGDRVAKGDKILEVYKEGYSDNLSTDLERIQQDIKKYVEENFIQDIIQDDINSLEEEITAKINEIVSVLDGTSDEDLLKLENQLKNLLGNRQKLYKSKSQEDDAELKRLLQQEEQYTENIARWKTEVFSEDAGIVSFYCDGVEQLLTRDKLDKITAEQFTTVLKSIKETTATTGAQKPLYRLVDNFKWYLAVMSQEAPIDEFKVDTKFNIQFESIYDRPYEGRVVSVRELEAGYLYVFEIVEDIGPLIGLRIANMELSRDFEGMKIPSSSIKIVDEIKGVYAKGSSGKTFIPIEIIVDNGDESIIKPLSGYNLAIGQYIE